METNRKVRTERRTLGSRSSIAALLALALVIAACGSGEDSSDAAGTDEETAATETEEETPVTETEEQEEPVGGESPVEVEWTWDHSITLPNTAFDELITDDLPRILSEATDGRLAVNVLYGQASPVDTIDAVSDGRFDGGTVVPAYVAGTYRHWNPTDIPLFFEDWDHHERVLREGIRDMLVANLESDTNALAPAGFLPWGQVGFYTNQPVETAADWEGLRIRSGNPDWDLLIEALGGSGSTMPFGDIYPSLERGAIDGFMSVPGAALSINPWEVTDYFNEWPTAYSMFVPAVNADSFAELDPSLQEAVIEGFVELEDYAWQAIYEDYQEVVERFRDEGLTFVTPDPDEVAEIRERYGDEFIEAWIDRAGERGQELVDAMQSVPR